ncbi:hypothetical protein AXG93_1175s1340 [Marchantia polymorpha subsp. ruderalis]|uniref:Uncharacterized protein n=1 Tax=Marchantia polymorpha subsp. ruderalis TaxID=1480154 RepID=A0A176VMG2_MARPO|nr:hypothetical protein AXG93_1175s1340 [Marchantia polymorpha subsp. ruderalis]
MKKAEEPYRQLRDESTDELKLRLEKCLNGFAMWRLQPVKWLVLDSLERRLMSTKTRIGVDVSSHDTVTATSDGTAPETDSLQAIDIPVTLGFREKLTRR